MKVDLKKLKSIIELAKEMELAELTIENKDDKIQIKLPYGQAMPLLSPGITASSGIATTSSGDTATTANAIVDKNIVEVTSPFVGTFYRSSGPDSEPYVKVGDSVTSGSILCIIEAMKIMNEIESEASGEIVEICVENETYVEFGQVLFKIKTK